MVVTWLAAGLDPISRFFETLVESVFEEAGCAGSENRKLERMYSNYSTVQPTPVSGIQILILPKNNHKKIIGFLKPSSTTSFY